MVGVFVYTAYYLGLVGSSNSGCEGEGGKRQSDPDLRAAYHFHSLTLGLITVACIFTTFITVREQKGESHSVRCPKLVQLVPCKGIMIWNCNK